MPEKLPPAFCGDGTPAPAMAAELQGAYTTPGGVAAVVVGGAGGGHTTHLPAPACALVLPVLGQAPEDDECLGFGSASCFDQATH